jgi:Protein of unknown function (DUF3179)
MPQNSDRLRSHGYWWFLFGISAIVCMGWFFVPAFIIRPFSHQTPGGLALAMALRQRAPWVTLAAAGVCLWSAAAVWPGIRRWQKVVLALVMVPVGFSAVMARINYFEWMFHPVDSAQFESATASKLDGGEMILAVRFGAVARAYPIREMAYHHVLNDVVGGVPIAATY